MISRLRYTFRGMWASLSRNLTLTVAAVITSTVSLFLFGGTLLIQPSKKNTHALLDKVRQIIRRHRGLSQTDLIRQLNPVLRGWAFYHRHIAAKRTYKKVEWAVCHSLLRWGKHRHSNKSSHWVMQKYWHPLDGRNEFAADTGTRTPDGKIIWRHNGASIYRCCGWRVSSGRCC